MGKLTATTVRALLRTPGKYGDGDGVWLYVTTADRAHWFLHYGSRGKQRQMSLGNAREVSLADARDKAQLAREQIAEGVDPIEQRRAQRDTQATHDANTFAKAAEEYITANEAAWRNRHHRYQWRSTLQRFAYPVIGNLPCNEVNTEHVLQILRPIWTTMSPTATRTRGRIEIVLSYATARGWRSGPNPALWRGHLQMMLPAKGKIHKVTHHAALDWREAPEFMVKLRERDSFGARALEFAILTAARSGEVRGARWSEIDVDTRVWTIPADRMKGGREHRVPLSDPAMAILAELAKLKDGSDHVFLGMRYGAMLSDMSLTAVLRRMGRGELTAHGFRSTFKDWSAETTNHPNDVVELALAHAIGNAVERAYRRGDLFEKRAALMADWAAYLARPPAEIVALRPKQMPTEATA